MADINEFLAKDALFLVWGPPIYGPRSKVLTRELGLNSIHFVYSTTRRGGVIGPLKYTYQALATLRLLFRERPKLVFVQNPPSFAVFFVYLYCMLVGARFVVDAHSIALQKKVWMWPGWLTRMWVRAAVTTLVTNEHFQQKIQAWGGHSFVLRDIPTEYTTDENYPLNGNFNVVVVNTFAWDEPIGEILTAAEELPQVSFYVTGKTERASQEVLESAPANVHFTGYLADPTYFGLMNTSDSVMCLTTRDNTMQRGACEALSMGKPIITSDWPLLREYFSNGTVHVSNSSESIRQGVSELVNHYDSYQNGIQELQTSQRREWDRKLDDLMDLLRQTMPTT